MDRYLGGEEIDVDVLVSDLETAVARGSFFPVLATSAETGPGHGGAAGGADPCVPVPGWSGTCRPVTGLAGAPAGAAGL